MLDKNFDNLPFDFQISESFYKMDVEDENGKKRDLLLSPDAMKFLCDLDSCSLAIRYAYCYGLYMAGAFGVKPGSTEQDQRRVKDIERKRAKRAMRLKGTDVK